MVLNLDILHNIRDIFIIKKYILDNCKKNIDYIDVVKWCCMYDRIDIIGLLFTNLNQKIIINNKKDFFFHIACVNGSLHTAQWFIYNYDEINISKNNDEIFRGVCFYGHIKMAQWLLEIKHDINITINNNESFFWACKNGHLNVTKWLFAVNPSATYLSDYFYNVLFKVSCEYNRINMCKWLLSIHPNIDITFESNYCFHFVCNKGYLELAKWLESLNNSYKIYAVGHNNVIIHNIEYENLAR